MMNRSPVAVYVGEQTKGLEIQRTAEALGWTVYVATEKLAALAMYVFYFPDLVVVDATDRPDVAKDVLFHLRSIHEDSLLVITNDLESDEWAEKWEGAALLSRQRPISDLARAMNVLVNRRSQDRHHQSSRHACSAP